MPTYLKQMTNSKRYNRNDGKNWKELASDTRLRRMKILICDRLS